jgi:hypothetical protein
MQETCDHCGPSVRAFVFVMVGQIETTWCGHCAGKYYEAWLERGYSIIADLRETT